jgi:hypothetical protein
MYPNITPELKVKSTISHPLEKEKVIGFNARNAKLGRKAIVIKEDYIKDGKVLVPTSWSTHLINGDGELVVLDGGNVLTMTAKDFQQECSLHSIGEGTLKLTLNYVPVNSPRFRAFDRSDVEIGTYDSF